MELLFQIAAKSKKCGTGWDKGHRLSAAQTLMSYRYPKLKALEITNETDTPKIQISWMDETNRPLATENQLDLLGVQEIH
jgi:hypothetical protein